MFLKKEVIEVRPHMLVAFLLCACQPTESPPSGRDYAAYLALPLEQRQQPAHATDAFAVAEGLEVRLFASEPWVINPTNLSIDAQGRVWVCESYNYAVPEAERTESGGRIIILEDTDGDGKADDRKVFYQGDDVNTALGISVFGNRVFVARSPNLLVFTDENGDDIPDKKEAVFTGMGGPGDHSAHAVVFGPDGRFYFNYGNAGIHVLSAAGDTLRDLAGHHVRSDGQPYHGGMVFRFDQDLGNFEVLGHNFRNNYEVAIDAFGTLWQSDNDDDGNKGVRINYVMEYGNFGYLDEYTGAHWTTPRAGMHDDIPVRHWHQNDPGVVPNLLLTGAGSPAGITVYEGDLLPKIFQGQVIHADAGPNVVRAYPVQVKGAGYQAKEQDMVRSMKDQWFRPVDVATAPDGSLFVADWYDPIVGGGAAGDHTKGRIFRIAPPDHNYQVAEDSLRDLAHAGAQIDNPNEAVRYESWQMVRDAGEEARSMLEGIRQEGSLRARARALWLLGQLPDGQNYVSEALKAEEDEIVIVALRLARQLGLDILPLAESILSEASRAVLREVAIALRYDDRPRAAKLWAQLASKHDGKDRWYLEALGIGADRHWQSYFDAWLTSVGADWNNPEGRDIVWRARAPAAIPLLAELITDVETDSVGRLRYFRAFDFHVDPLKNDVLLSLLEVDHPDQVQIRALALQHVDAQRVTLTPPLRRAIDETLEDMEGTWPYVDLVERFQLTDKKTALLELALQSNGDVAARAARLLVEPERFKGLDLVEARLHQDDADAPKLLIAMQSIGSKPVLQLMQRIVLDDRLSMDLRKTAVQAMGMSWWGEDHLLEVVKDPDFPETLEPAAASILFSVYRTSIHEEAAEYLDRPGSSERTDLPPIRQLIATEGNPDRGHQVFDTYCQSCHLVEGEGIDFGPDLSLIGDKLSSEGLYRAIIYPSEGVNYDYETYQLTLRSGAVFVGLLASETEEKIDLKFIGGTRQSYARTEVEGLEMLSHSLMTNLSLAMRTEELIDLVSYLRTLRESELE